MPNTYGLNRKAGYYELEEARLTKLDDPSQWVDIQAQIHHWSISESMDNGYLHGKIFVVDAAGLFYNFLRVGLKGEEEIRMTYRDFFGNRLTHLFFVYAVTEVKTFNPQAETALSYTLHFVSKEKFYTDRFKIRRSYNNDLISEYVRSMWKEFWVDAFPGVLSTYNRPLSEEDIHISVTKGKQSLVVPNYRPEEAMQFMARKAISGLTINKTHTYRFFQNRSKFHFTNHDYLNVFIDQDFLGTNEKRNMFIQVNNPDNTPEGQEFMMQNIIDIEFPTYVNTMRDMNEGRYLRTTTELDFMNRTILTTPWKFLDEYTDAYLPDYASTSAGRDQFSTKAIHSREFAEKHFKDYEDTLVIKDYPPLTSERLNTYVRHNPFYAEIYNAKTGFLHHHTDNMVKMKTYGRNTLTAGELIRIEILESLGNIGDGRKIDEERSGYYLIEEVENIFYEDTYYQIFSMSKSGLKGTPEAGETPQEGPFTLSAFNNSLTGTPGNE